MKLGVAGCVALPGLPLRVLYGSAAVTPEAIHLVRVVVLAMTPLSLAYLLMNFEMAQQRFRAVPWLVLAAATYIGSALTWHASAAQVTGGLALGGLVATAGLLACMPWRDLLGRSSAP